MEIQGERSISELSRALESVGLVARTFRIPTHRLCNNHLPAILHWADSHFVVLVSIQNDQYELHDPDKGWCLLPFGEFSEHYSGVAIVVQELR